MQFRPRPSPSLGCALCSVAHRLRWVYNEVPRDGQMMGFKSHIAWDVNSRVGYDRDLELTASLNNVLDLLWVNPRADFDFHKGNRDDLYCNSQ